MRKCERSYPIAGTSALKPRPCPTRSSVRIIAFPQASGSRHQSNKTQNPTSLSSRQSAVLFAIGCVLAFGALVLPF